MLLNKYTYIRRRKEICEAKIIPDTHCGLGEKSAAEQCEEKSERQEIFYFFLGVRLELLYAFI